MNLPRRDKIEQGEDWQDGLSAMTITSVVCDLGDGLVVKIDLTR